MITDPIANMLTSIRNALSAGFESVEVPASKIKANICKVLKEEGFIRSFKILAQDPAKLRIRIYLKEGALQGISRSSKPGLRKYQGYLNFNRVRSGLGVTVISTSKGVLSSRKAKQLKVGGEVICSVW
ncbi:MAG: 30S ribosomal protein S8 [Bacteriovoracaceae bacterium]|nr:30S ribosomal protein S8 [Bacteriovoracaceae bacterium]